MAVSSTRRVAAPPLPPPLPHSTALAIDATFAPDSLVLDLAARGDSLRVPGFFSGKLADALGYQTFFTVVLFCAIPGLLAAWFAPFVHKMNDGSDKPASGEAPASA